MEHILSGLNQAQYEAVTYGDGPLLVFAGAGSGKTRVLTNRIAYLIEEKGVSPYNILAVTFTNKAAGEMKERIHALVGYGAYNITVGTFHSVCARILRAEAEKVGLDRQFVIFDTDDQTTIVKDCCEELHVDTARLTPKSILHRISAAKNELISPFEMQRSAATSDERIIGRIFERYNALLKINNALDFDDLLVKAVELFKGNEELLEEYREKYKYIFVDEFQDINAAQNELITLLAAKYRNLCVVGDDDHSIYGWRGADMNTILNYEKVYPDAKVIKLEQNYRSAQNILDAAHAVIAQNRIRKDKKLWSEKRSDDKIKYYHASDEASEAAFIARTIRDMVDNGDYAYSDFAVLYRINAQSRVLEQHIAAMGVPYRIVGGLKFFARKEVKDIIAYLRLIYNPADSVSLRRIINVPTRGIGGTSLEKVIDVSLIKNISIYEQLLHPEECGLTKRAETAINDFTNLITSLRLRSNELSIAELLEAIIVESGYEKSLMKNPNDIQDKTRLENIKELKSVADEFIKNSIETETEASLELFLENVSLLSEVENAPEGDSGVTLMTLHAAKGLEFSVVFLTGLEDNIFPIARALFGASMHELEEERRLCYVGMTRAKEKLYLTLAMTRTIFGKTDRNRPSQFFANIPMSLLEPALTADKQFASETTTPTEIAEKVRRIIVATSQDGLIGFRAGDRVHHHVFGDGMVLAISGSGAETKLKIHFKRAGVKNILLSMAKLEKI